MIHVIIPTTGIPELERTLADYAKFIPHCRLIVVLNTDDENRLPVVKKWFDQAVSRRTDCKLISTPKQVGYVLACNIGYEQAAAADDDYIAVVNDDIEATGDWITPLQEALDEGAAWAGPAVWRIGEDGGDDKPVSESGVYYFVAGWCFLIKNSAIQQVGGLYDPAFSPGYREDDDLGIRIRNLGGTTALVSIPLNHLQSRTFSKTPRTWLEDNHLRLNQKWHLPPPVWVPK